MPNTASARKHVRASAKKQARNDHARSGLTNLRRKFRKAVSEGNAADATTIFQELQRTLDTAARRHIIHRNAAARTKSRLSAEVARLRI